MPNDQANDRYNPPGIGDNDFEPMRFDEIEDEDLFIGANGNREVGMSSAIDNKQFMGEMHEMCLTSVIRRRFPSTTNLLPNYNDTLFYFRFEEVDLWH